MDDTTIPLIFYGDGPRLPSGLGRIARDLLVRVLPLEEAFGVAVHQLGVDPPDGWHWRGWPLWGFQPDHRDQGRLALALMVEELAQHYTLPPIVFMIMDPSRCYDLTHQERETGQGIPASFWGYFPIDSENVQGRIGGPAAEAVWSCDRVLGYGAYGARVLKSTRQHVATEKVSQEVRQRTQLQVGGVPYLPHGMDGGFVPGIPLSEAGPGFAEWVAHTQDGALIIGCVATNQARKDLSLLFASAAILKRQGYPVGIWLHTDRLTNAWDIGQLSVDFGMKRDEVCVSTQQVILTDHQLSARYGASGVTLGVGLGEGFGYPLVESLASGTPVIHGNFAGGADLIAHPRWKIQPAAWRLESCYGVKRPVLAPEVVATALLEAAQWKRQDPRRCAAYCSGAVAHLAWEQLWPRWQAWIQRGLQEHRLAHPLTQKKESRRGKETLAPI